MKRAVFLDRDGVLIEDRGPISELSQVHCMEDVAETLRELSAAGFALVVVTNQSIVARGLATEGQIEAIHEHILSEIEAMNGPKIDGVYFCPHHPEASLPTYRQRCECRKPKAGMLIQAAREHGIDLARSWLVGDRMSDINAGAKAGCRTVLVETGMHEAPPILSDGYDEGIRPDFEARSLAEAGEIIRGFVPQR